MTATPENPLRALWDGVREAPEDAVEEVIRRTQIKTYHPSTHELAVRLEDNTIHWWARFRDAMQQLCQLHGIPGPVPTTLMAAAIREKGILLLWPGGANDPDGFDVNVYEQGGKITTTLTEALSVLKVDLPNNTSVAVPVTPYKSRQYGPCLALHLTKARFLRRDGVSQAAAGAQEPES